MRSSYGTKIHYQRLALESRQEWLRMNQDHGDELFVACGMLRVQPSNELGSLERETLVSMERDGIRHTQFIKSDADDRQRAAGQGWDAKLLDFRIPDEEEHAGIFEAVLDSVSGFVKSSEACKYFRKKAASDGVKFIFGPSEGRFESLVSDADAQGKTAEHLRKVIGIKTADGVVHLSDTVVIAGKTNCNMLCHDRDPGYAAN